MRAIICDDRLAPAGQTSGVAIETKESERKDCAQLGTKNDVSCIRKEVPLHAVKACAGGEVNEIYSTHS